MAHNTESNTIAALLTGTGRGAVATVMVRGADAERLVHERFENAFVRRSGFQLNKLHFGTWRWRDYSEELVVCRIEHDVFEIHCHGGNVASKRVLDSLVDGGAELVLAQETLLESVTDKFVRTAIELIPSARTERIAALLLEQSRGALRQTLLEVVRLLETNEYDAAKNRVGRLLELGRFGVRLDKPFSVVLVGAPNAGKSSLINALLGYERSIVFDQPGTTRDLVRAETAVDGWPIQLTDTAGVRETDNRIEREGVRLAKQSLHDCDLAIVVQDLTSETVVEPVDFGLVPNQLYILVGTKADLAEGDSSNHKLDILTSTATNLGIEELTKRIARTLVPTHPQLGEALPLDTETQSALIAIHRCIDNDAIVDAKSLLADLLD